MDEIMPRKHPDWGFTEIYIHAHKKNLIFLRDLKLRSAFKRNFFLPLSKKSFVKEFHDGGTSIESMRSRLLRAHLRTSSWSRATRLDKEDNAVRSCGGSDGCGRTRTEKDVEGM